MATLPRTSFPFSPPCKPRAYMLQRPQRRGRYNAMIHGMGGQHTNRGVEGRIGFIWSQCWRHQLRRDMHGEVVGVGPSKDRFFGRGICTGRGGRETKEGWVHGWMGAWASGRAPTNHALQRAWPPYQGAMPTGITRGGRGRHAATRQRCAGRSGKSKGGYRYRVAGQGTGGEATRGKTGQGSTQSSALSPARQRRAAGSGSHRR